MTGVSNSRIDHVVVLMLENRSFDHMFGFLTHPKQSQVNGLIGDRRYNVDAEGVEVTADNSGVPIGLSPDHSHQGAMLQRGGFGRVAENGGFVESYRRVKADETVTPEEAVAASHKPMACLDPEQHLPVLARLAREFAQCPTWFSSVPGQTWPNRNFAHAGTSDSAVDIELGFFRDKTIFEQLEKVRQSWHIYYDGTPQAWCFPRLWKPSLIVDFLMRRPPRIGHWYEMPFFAAHVAEGRLPAYSFIEPAHNQFHSGQVPRRTNSQHPENNLGDDEDFRAGERLITQVYEALRVKPEVFARTLLLITYDEHGGLYDYVPPRGTIPPGDAVHRRLLRRLHKWHRYRHAEARTRQAGLFDFKTLGFRVPAVLVSPWIAQHTILDDQGYEHASIPATVRAIFAPGLPALTDRDAAAMTFHHVVDGSPLERPRISPGSLGGDVSGVPLPVFVVPDEDDAGGSTASSFERGDRSSLDGELDDLAELTRSTLQSSLAARLLLRRAPGRGGELAVDPDIEPVDLFAATAGGARLSP